MAHLPDTLVNRYPDWDAEPPPGFPRATVGMP